MKTLSTTLGLLSFSAVLASTALAQAPAEGLPPPPRVQQTEGVDYLNGGAGEESRQAIEKMQSRFMLRNVFSGEGGQYVVANTVSVRGPSGKALEIRNAGPILMIDLPPGAYTIEVDVAGKLQRKTVTLGQQPMKLNWNWPGA